jgi:hypothetical protein
MPDHPEISDDLPLPPANFTFLVESIMLQTQMQLGLLSLGDEEPQAEPNLAVASHSIDLLGMLQEKTRGNLTTEEKRTLDNGLTELRFRFVQVADELERKSEAPPEPKPLIVTADGGKGTKTA